MTILGYIIWGISVLFAFGYCFNIRQKAKNEQSREKAIELQGFLFSVSVVLIPTQIRKLSFGQKHLFVFCLLVIVACTASTPPIRENEKKLVGNWIKPVNNGPMEGMYMEFHEDRTGFFGLVVNIKGKVGMAPYMSMLMKDWRIQNDTLSIQMEMQPGLAFYGPDGKEIKKNDKPSFVHYIVWEVSDTVVVLQDLVGEFPVKDRLKKCEKIGIIE